MGELKKLSLLEETVREAKEIEEAIKADPELDDIRVTEEMDAALFAKIKAFEEENKKNNEKKEIKDEEDFSEKTYPYRKKSRKRYIIIGLAAVLGLVLWTGIVGVGNKSYWKEKEERNWEQGEEEQQVIRVEDMDDIYSEDGLKKNIYDQIEQELGTNIVALRYTPKNFLFLEMEILGNMQQARVFYEYEGEIVRYTIYLNSKDSSWAEKIEDEKINEYLIVVESEVGTEVEILIEEFRVPQYDEYRRVANFEYKGVHYQLKGVVKKEEFDNILKNLYFL